MTDCQPWQCGAPAQYITDQARRDCPFWGPSGVLGCSNIYCSLSPWCSGSAASVGPVSASPHAPAAAAPAVSAPPSQPAAVTVQTQAGPVLVSSDIVPGVADTSLVPAMVSIPNIWDLLDPTAISQFEYRGISTSLPPWISQDYRRQLALDSGQAVVGPDGQLVAAGSSDSGGGSTIWVWLLIAGAAMYLGDKKKQRRRRA